MGCLWYFIDKAYESLVEKIGRQNHLNNSITMRNFK